MEKINGFSMQSFLQFIAILLTIVGGVIWFTVTQTSRLTALETRQVEYDRRIGVLEGSTYTLMSSTSDMVKSTRDLVQSMADYVRAEEKKKHASYSN